MKVLIVHDFDPLDASAIPTNTLSIAKGLVQKGVAVTIASPNTRVSDKFRGVCLEKLATSSELAQLIGNVDVVIPMVNFTSTFKPLGVVTALMCRNLQKQFIPIVGTTLNVSKFNLYKGISDFDQSLNNELLSQVFSSKYCQKIVCVSNAVKRSLQDFGVNNDKLVVIYNGIDMQKIETVRKMNLPKEFDVIFAGRLSKEKGITQFLSALKLVSESLAAIKACIIGQGLEEGLAKSLVKVLNLEKNVTFIPKLENGELLQQLSRSRVLVNTSYTESFGFTIVEAMALGLIVVAPNIEGPKELIKNSKTGFLYRLCDTSDVSAKIILGLCPDKNIEGVRNNAILSVQDTFSVNNQTKKLFELLGACSEDL